VPALAGAIAGFTSSGRSMEVVRLLVVVIGLVYGILNGLRLGAPMAESKFSPHTHNSDLGISRRLRLGSSAPDAGGPRDWRILF